SLTNESQAWQSLGFYLKACNTLLEAFEIQNLGCNKLTQDNSGTTEKTASGNQGKSDLQEPINTLFDNLTKQDDFLSLTKAIGLRRLGDVLRRIGALDESQAVLEISLEVAKNRQSAEEQSAANLDFGNTARALGNRERSLEDPVKIADNIGLVNQDCLKARNCQKDKIAQDILNTSYPYKGYYRKALDAYKEAANLSPSSDTRIQAQLNQLRLLLEIGQMWQSAIEAATQRNPDITSYWSELNSYLTPQAQSLLEDIYSQFSNFQPNQTTIYTLFNLTDILTKSDSAISLDKPEGWRDQLAEILEKAAEYASNLGDKRAEAYALGYRGKLYEQEASYPNEKNQPYLLKQAQDFTQKAIIRLSKDTNTDNRDITYNLEWQLGRILKGQGDIKGATAAYALAFQNINDYLRRQDLIGINRDVQFFFRDVVEPIHRDYIGLLLQPDKNITNDDLTTARNVIESLQLAELENYLSSGCKKQENIDIDKFIDEKAQNSAVIYPIIVDYPLKKEIRLEIILKLPNKEILLHKTTLISRKKLDSTLDDLSKKLNGSVNIIQPQKTLADLVKELNNKEYDLRSSLQEIYKWLIDPIKEDLTSANIDTLVFVLDSRLQNIPIATLYNEENQLYLLQEYSIALTPGLQLTDPNPLTRKTLKVLGVGVSEKNLNHPELSEVKTELDKIQSLLPDSNILLNENFSKENFQDQLSEQSNLPILHWGSHGEFSSNPNRAYISLWGENIYINDLDRLFENTDSIGLLVLSGCETAQGDRRSVLGLAGVAVQSSARSTIATFWDVEDSTAARLIGKFYENLVNDRTLTKAKALRNAQLDLLENSDYTHPVFWAAYVLVGNWL
ncbi:MAG TPA: hypothetical protein DC064_24615, partial [Cyanobacteria bacterium UBA9273]|nr:hypothetical protein [Cyanobacteria bacterium UBA9273]